MENGLIYLITNWLIDKFTKINLVELFKILANKLNPEKNNPVKSLTYYRVAVDIFIVLKWIFILIIWNLHISNLCVSILVWYLIITNLYTYFYYHVWCDEAFETNTFTRHRIRRRFVNLFLAFAFSNISFAYLYYLPYSKDMNWGMQLPATLNAIWFSFSNSVAANYAVVSPSTNLGNSVAMIQLIVTFIFVTIIISKSIPQENPKNT